MREAWRSVGRATGLAAVVLTTMACGGSDRAPPGDSKDSREVTAQPSVDASKAIPVGRYEVSPSTNPGDSPISALLFYDAANVLVTFAPCPTGESSCTVHATYQFDIAQHTLSITDDLTKKTLTGPVEPTGASSVNSPLTTQSLETLGLISWFGDALTGIGNFFLSGFKWVGRNVLGITDGFNGNDYTCHLSTITMSDGRLVSVPPELQSTGLLHVTTSRAWGGYPQIMADTIDGRPIQNAQPHFIENGLARTNNGTWVSMDSTLFAGKDGGKVTYALPSGPAEYTCNTPNSTSAPIVATPLPPP